MQITKLDEWVFKDGKKKYRLALLVCDRCGKSWKARLDNAGKHKACKTCSHVTLFISSRTRAFRCWKSMIERCHNKKNKAYPQYGARGIVVCERWHVLENFITDMGEPPDRHTIDRLNNVRGYAPDNCRWATKRQQDANKRCRLWVTHEGETLSLQEFAQKIGVSDDCVRENKERFGVEKGARII